MGMPIYPQYVSRNGLNKMSAAEWVSAERSLYNIVAHFGSKATATAPAAA